MLCHVRVLHPSRSAKRALCADIKAKPEAKATHRTQTSPSTGDKLRSQSRPCACRKGNESTNKLQRAESKLYQSCMPHDPHAPYTSRTTSRAATETVSRTIGADSEFPSMLHAQQEAPPVHFRRGRLRTRQARRPWKRCSPGLAHTDIVLSGFQAAMQDGLVQPA